MNPQKSNHNNEKWDWRDLFNVSESPYLAMYRAGTAGIPIADIAAHCQSLNIPIRHKDINNWKSGRWNWEMKNQQSVLNPLLRIEKDYVHLPDTKLHDLEQWPTGWNGTDHRWFPCTSDNRPMQKWGYSPGYTPILYERADAQALSPCGWVGQNMYAQPFMVIDIDGVGHGDDDPQVIAFGERFRNMTETWENPSKPGSFHLYFNTPYKIPIRHYPYARLDVMGNEKNAAVYTKDKQSNGVPRALLTEEVWEALQQYIKERDSQRQQQIAERKEVSQ